MSRARACDGRRFIRGMLAATALAGAVAAPASATEAPLWEFGLGAGTVAFADYRGAAGTSVYLLPVPYFIYRGDVLKSDRNGLRGLLFDSRIAELNVSVSATTPVRSRDEPARAGMPDLKPTFEVGPSLDVHLWRSDGERVRLDLRLPVRRVITIERQPRAVGWLATPRLNLDIRDLGGHAGWDAGLLAGPLFADQAYHDYFYTVSPQFVTPQRPAYRAAGGYSGTETIAALSKRFPKFWVGAFVRYDVLAGARFVPSPLVRRQDYWAGGLGFAWMIGKSTRLVDSQDLE